VGNKIDMENERKVSTEEGQALASQLGAYNTQIAHALTHTLEALITIDGRAGCKFLESSAKANVNVEECFLTLVADIKAFKTKYNNAPPSNILTRPPKRKHCRLY
jgi:GTPase SAR1 family protein